MVDRVEPPCPHYLADRCGGCQLMHLDGEAQVEAKRRIIGDALRRIAKLEVKDPPIHRLGAPLGYRTKVSFTVADGRIGFHRLGDPGQVFAVRQCLLLAPDLDVVHQQVQRHAALLPPDAVRLVLRRDAEGTRHVVVETSGAAAWTGAAALHRHLDPEVVVWWHPAGGTPRAMAGALEPWPATVFEQVNPEVAGAVRATAVARLSGKLPPADGDPPKQVWDLYAGIGETTALLQGAGHAVQSVEIDPRAVAMAERRGPSGPIRLTGDVATVIGRLSRADWVLTNPPRTGMDAAVTAAIADSGASRVVYVSCDPATLARDIGRLAPRYRLTSLEGFDQFPQTAHVECVAVLERQ